MQSLDIHRFPLDGIRLIEASAGTGKTYTIATLFLRLLLERRLEVDQILVVTFTKAATEELRDRIRARVGEALMALQGHRQQGQDPVLDELLSKIEDKDEAGGFLADALTRMDESAVFTIHGFCQRVLQENAFESGAPFEAEFITDETLLRHTIVRDFWRQNSQGKDYADSAWLLSKFKTPNGLLNRLKSVLSQGELEIVPEVDFTKAEAALNDTKRAFKQWQAAYENDPKGPVEILKTHANINRSSYTKVIVARVVAGLSEVMALDSLPLSMPIEIVERFSHEMLCDKAKAGKSAPEHSFFKASDRFLEVFRTLQSLREAAWLTECWLHLKDQLKVRKAELQMLYFDDLLQQLSDALQGDRKTTLAAAILKRYPVAMIDEFQDTDPLQYRIFSTIYREEEAGTGLFMIGDPKQAIYSFRGADVFTYMQARALTDDTTDRFTLKTNWRSASALIRAVETLFTHRSANRPFVYDKEIRYIPVSASPTADDKPLRVDGEVPTPLQFWHMPVAGKTLDNVSVSKQRAAFACAQRIAELLNKAKHGHATIGDKPLQAQHIAVLVRSHSQGDLMQQTLGELGVASVSLSRQSVFQSAQAEDLEVLLKAVIDPRYEGGIRAALSGELLGRSASQLHLLREDEDAWEAEVQLFRQAHQIWAGRGFIAAFLHVLRGEQIVPRLLARPGGERSVTNLMQLAELLQVASLKRIGMEPLLHWFAEQREDDGEDETKQLRLESDAALVQIVTVHKSKGLEYPIVFLPFMWSVGGRDSDVLFHGGEDKHLIWDVGSPDRERHKEETQSEKLAEDVRLVYVAVTRAKHLCVVPWGRTKTMDKTALAWLLHQREQDGEYLSPNVKSMNDEDLLADVQQVVDQSGGSVSLEQILDVDSTPVVYEGDVENNSPLAAQTFNGQIRNDWRLVSYSSLAKGDHGGGKTDPESPDHDDLTVGPKTLSEPIVGPVDDIFRFPRGPRAGTFLHLILEHLDFTETRDDVLAQSVESALVRHGFEARWQSTICGMLKQVLDTDLSGNGLFLRDLEAHHRRDEMEFVFPLNDLTTHKLSALLGQQDLSLLANNLNFDPARGLMKGYIDLVFEKEGCFYLADYKSNHLGDQASDYGMEALEIAMSDHQYDLQYLIYSVALHRFLATRIADYDYQRHFGGVYYLFLRGMRVGQTTGVYHAKPPLSLIHALDSLFAGDDG